MERENELQSKDTVSTAATPSLLTPIIFVIFTIIDWRELLFYHGLNLMPEWAVVALIFGAVGFFPFLSFVSFVSYIRGFDRFEEDMFVKTCFIKMFVYPVLIFGLAGILYIVLGGFFGMPFWACILASLLLFKLI